MPTIDALWGGQLKSVGFNPVVHNLELQVDVNNNGTWTAYELVCSEVSEFRFSNSILEPWSYAEVTEVHTSRTNTGKWMVDIVLWSEDCELVCVCDAFTVTEGFTRRNLP